MKKGDEIITLKIERSAFERLYNEGLIELDNKDFELSKVEPFQESYPEDERWMQLKKESLKAYKELKEYEFNLRHK